MNNSLYKTRKEARCPVWMEGRHTSGLLEKVRQKREGELEVGPWEERKVGKSENNRVQLADWLLWQPGWEKTQGGRRCWGTNWAEKNQCPSKSETFLPPHRELPPLSERFSVRTNEKPAGHVFTPRQRALPTIHLGPFPLEGPLSQ